MTARVTMTAAGADARAGMGAGARGVARGVAPLILFALFIVVLLLLLAGGVRVYQSLVAEQDVVKAQRFGTGLLVNSVRAADAYDAISAGPGPEGEVLVLSEATAAGMVETRIYLHEGRLLQEYVLAGADYRPDQALEIMQTDAFSFSFADGLLTLSTSYGSVDVALRTQEVGL